MCLIASVMICGYLMFIEGWHRSFPWATRMKVAIGAAGALAFLHDLETPIIHRDVKSGAILLDDVSLAMIPAGFFCSDLEIHRRIFFSEDCRISTPSCRTLALL